MLSIGLLAALLTVSFDTSAAILDKYAVYRINNYKLSTLILGIGVLPMLGYLLLVGATKISGTAALCAVAAGVFLCLGFVLFFKSLKTEQVTNTNAVGPLQQLIILSSGLIVFGERLAPVQIFSATLIFIGVMLVITKTGFRLNRGLVPAVFANISWAVYWILLAYAITISSYVMPTLIARITGFLVIAAYSLFAGKLDEKPASKKASKKPVCAYLLPIVVILGAVCDAGTNISFGFAISRGLVALGSAIFATAPIFIALFGVSLYKDKLTLPQVIGVVIAVAGAVAIIAA